MSRYLSSSAAPSSGSSAFQPSSGGTMGSLVVGRLGELVRHLEEEQQRQLLDIFEAGESGVLQDSGVAPGPFADLGCDPSWFPSACSSSVACADSCAGRWIVLFARFALADSRHVPRARRRCV